MPHFIEVGSRKKLEPTSIKDVANKLIIKDYSFLPLYYQGIGAYMRKKDLIGT